MSQINNNNEIIKLSRINNSDNIKMSQINTSGRIQCWWPSRKARYSVASENTLAMLTDWLLYTIRILSPCTAIGLTLHFKQGS